MSEGSSSEIADLRAAVQNQQVAVTKLLLQQEALVDDKGTTSAHRICEETLKKGTQLVARGDAHPPMSRVDRRRSQRDHGGSHPRGRLPKELPASCQTT